MIKFHPKYKYEESHGWGVCESHGTINNDHIRLERIDDAGAFDSDLKAMQYVCNMALYLHSEGNIENNYMYALKTLYANKDRTSDYRVALTFFNTYESIVKEIESYKGD